MECKMFGKSDEEIDEWIGRDKCETCPQATECFDAYVKGCKDTEAV